MNPADRISSARNHHSDDWNWSEMKQPWKTLKSTRLIETKWMAVREDEVITHKGEVITYTLVEHPGAVFIVPVTPEGELILLHQYRYTVGEWCWEVPAGGMYESRDHKTIAAKELDEEVGGSHGDLTYVGSFYLSNGLSNERGHVYLATDVIPGDTNLEGTELLETHRYGVDEAMRMARTGEISDGPSALALLMCEEKIRSRY